MLAGGGGRGDINLEFCALRNYPPKVQAYKSFKQTKTETICCQQTTLQEMLKEVL